MLLTIALAFLLVYNTNAEYEARCSNSTNTTLTFEPTNNGVEGQYTVEFCTAADKTVTVWEIILKYIKKKTPDKCKMPESDVLFDIIPYAVRHSRVGENIELNLNCTHVCFSRNMDLIFTGCYYLESWLRRGTRSSHTHDLLQYITNNIQDASYFNKSKTMVRTVSNGNMLYLYWYSGYVPITDYTLQLCKESDFVSSGKHTTQPTTVTVETSVSGSESGGSACRNIESQCAWEGRVAARNQLACATSAAAACYRAELGTRAPWRNGPLLQDALPHRTYSFCHPDESPRPVVVGDAGVGGGRAGWWWAGGAAGGALLAAAAAWAAWRTRLPAELRKQVLRDWLHRYEEFDLHARAGGGEGGEGREGGPGPGPKCGPGPGPSPGSGPGPGAGAGPGPGPERVDRVLLLYARDCEPAMRVVRALTDLIQEVAPQVSVVDVHAAETQGAGAPAPAQWARALLAAPRCRLLLLHTPAARCLYAPRADLIDTHADQHDHEHEHADADNASADSMQPLEPESAALGSRVFYREPAASDSLLQYALRLVTETHALRPDQYKRYYIASISGLPAETTPAVAPFRRYELPGAARVLARDVSGLAALPAPAPALARCEAALAAAIDDLLHFVAAHPDYLKDELVFL